MIQWLKKLFAPQLTTEEVVKKFVEIKEQSLEPWACFEVTGFEDNGRIRVEFKWNDAFIAKIRPLGFEAETEEDSVQLFFYTAQLRPTELSVGDESVNSVEHPTLSGPQNVFKS